MNTERVNQLEETGATAGANTDVSNIVGSRIYLLMKIGAQG